MLFSDQVGVVVSWHFVSCPFLTNTDVQSKFKQVQVLLTVNQFAFRVFSRCRCRTHALNTLHMAFAESVKQQLEDSPGTGRPRLPRQETCFDAQKCSSKIFTLRADLLFPLRLRVVHLCGL